MMTDYDDLMIPMFIRVLYTEFIKGTLYHVMVVSKA